MTLSRNRKSAFNMQRIQTRRAFGLMNCALSYLTGGFVECGNGEARPTTYRKKRRRQLKLEPAIFQEP
jgi:hypothetical protein